MNSSQMLLHIARRAADRLALDVSPDLPRAVSSVLADADRHVNGPREELPAARDAASLVARCAIVGWQTVRTRANGTDRQPKEDDLRRDLGLRLREDAAVPPGMPQQQFDLVLDVVADECAHASQRQPVRD